MFSLPLAPSCGSLPNTRFFPLLSAPPEKRWQCINSNDCAKRPIYKWLTKTEINVRAKDRSRITWCLFATVSHCCMAIKIFFVNLLYVYQIVLLVWCWTHAQFWYSFLLSHFMTRVQGNPKKIFDLQPCLLSIRFHSCVSSLDVQEEVFKRFS